MVTVPSNVARHPLKDASEDSTTTADGHLVLAASALLAPSASRGVTTTATPTNGLPLYQFVETGTEPLPWNARFLRERVELDHHARRSPRRDQRHRRSARVPHERRPAGGAHPERDAAPRPGSTTRRSNDVPAPGADPVPFFDPSGNVDLLYVDETRRR